MLNLILVPSSFVDWMLHMKSMAVISDKERNPMVACAPS